MAIQGRRIDSIGHRMYSDDELLPISALQHFVFCQRQCALIHIERLWADNRLTVEGNHLHRKTHEASGKKYGPRGEWIDGRRVVRNLWLVSRPLGLVGQADVVEFDQTGLATPVEYKRGRPKKNDSDRVQLCAQALCLEHQLGQSVTKGYFYYGTRKRRLEVILDDELRETTRQTIAQLRAMINARVTPTAPRMPKCAKCSLVELCLPNQHRLKSGAAAWNDRQWDAALERESPQTDPDTVAPFE